MHFLQFGATYPHRLTIDHFASFMNSIYILALLTTVQSLKLTDQAVLALSRPEQIDRQTNIINT